MIKTYTLSSDNYVQKRDDVSNSLRDTAFFTVFLIPLSARKLAATVEDDDLVIRRKLYVLLHFVVEVVISVVYSEYKTDFKHTAA